SVLKQFPLDFSQTGVLLEDRFFEIVAKRTALQAPGKSTELIEFRISGIVCQLCGVQPAIGVGACDVDRLRRNDEQVALGDVWQRVNFIAFSDAERAATLEEEGNVCAEARGNGQKPFPRQSFLDQPQIADQSRGRITGATAHAASRRDGFAQFDCDTLCNPQL